MERIVFNTLSTDYLDVQRIDIENNNVLDFTGDRFYNFLEEETIKHAKTFYLLKRDNLQFVNDLSSYISLIDQFDIRV